MTKQEELYNEFIEMVDPTYKDYINEMHDYLLDNDCTVSIKPSKMGYVVSYIAPNTKKTIFNYVFRKSGIMIRIYANNHLNYPDFLESLPDSMVKTIGKASPCKRLLDPTKCSSKCAMGYDFIINGEQYVKCRNNAFMFLLSEDHNPYIKSFVEHELQNSTIQKN